MDSAILAASNTSVSAAWYDDQSAVDRAAMKPQLVCPECRFPAFFVRRKRNNAAACFGARPHADGCEAASTMSLDGVPGIAVEAQQHSNDGTVWVLEAAAASSPGTAIDPDAGGGDSGRHGTAHTGGPAEPTERRGKSPGSLLIDLIRRPAVRTSAQRISVGSQVGTVADMCVALVDRRRLQVGVERIYWGTLRDVKDAWWKDEHGSWEHTGYWFNVADTGSAQADVTVHLDASLLERVLGHIRAIDISKLEQATFLTAGTLTRAKKPGRPPVLWIRSLDYFAIRDAGKDTAYI